MSTASAATTAKPRTTAAAAFAGWWRRWVSCEVCQISTTSSTGVTINTASIAAARARSETRGGHASTVTATSSATATTPNFSAASPRPCAVASGRVFIGDRPRVWWGQQARGRRTSCPPSPRSAANRGSSRAPFQSEGPRGVPRQVLAVQMHQQPVFPRRRQPAALGRPQLAVPAERDRFVPCHRQVAHDRGHAVVRRVDDLDRHRVRLRDLEREVLDLNAGVHHARRHPPAAGGGGHASRMKRFVHLEFLYGSRGVLEPLGGHERREARNHQHPKHHPRQPLSLPRLATRTPYGGAPLGGVAHPY